MTPYEFGDVVLVPFPFTSHAASKQRPAVVISSRSYGQQTSDLIMKAITSQLRSTPLFGEVWLRQWQKAGLLRPSAVKPVVATFEQRLVIRQLGVLDAADQIDLRTAVAQIVG